MSEPFPEGSTGWQLLHESVFLSLFPNASTYDQWCNTYGDNQDAIDFVGGVAAGITSVSEYIAELQVVIDFSEALNNVSSTADTVFEQVYDVTIETLTWQTEDYMKVLFDISLDDNNWDSITLFINQLEAIADLVDASSSAQETLEDVFSANSLDLSNLNLTTYQVLIDNVLYARDINDANQNGQQEYWSFNEAAKTFDLTLFIRILESTYQL
jgi:hypothetical protein